MSWFDGFNETTRSRLSWRQPADSGWGIENEPGSIGRPHGGNGARSRRGDKNRVPQRLCTTLGAAGTNRTMPQFRRSEETCAGFRSPTAESDSDRKSAPPSRP
jgi:hypothetical protein